MLFCLSLLANDIRVTVWTICTLFKESASKSHVTRQPVILLCPEENELMPLVIFSKPVAGVSRHKTDSGLSVPEPMGWPARSGVGGVLKVKNHPLISTLPKMHS